MTARPSRIAVLTTCTGQKVKSSDQLFDAPVPGTPEHRGLPQLVPAEQLYRGQQHLRLMRGVTAARKAGLVVDVSIVSAGYGLVAGDELLAPYERTFQGMPRRERRALARRLGIPAAVRQLFHEPADLIIVLLGDDYLDACDLQEDFELRAPMLVLCGASAALRLPRLTGLRPVVLHRDDTRRFACGLVGLKGEIAGRLLGLLAISPSLISKQLGGDMLARLEGAWPPTTEAMVS